MSETKSTAQMDGAAKPKIDWRLVLRQNWRKQLIVYWASDLLTKRRTAAEKERDEEEERAYRRGYLHGYSQAMDDMLAVSQREYSRVRECFNWLAAFYDDILYPWRYARHVEYQEPPRFQPPPRWSEQRAHVRRRDQTCVKCGQVGSLECDHIRPVSDGGRAELDNLRLLCGDCHRDRSRPL